jgi:hypothetical protein
MPLEAGTLFRDARACNSGKAMRDVDADTNASNITMSPEHTIWYVLAFSFIYQLL